MELGESLEVARVETREVVDELEKAQAATAELEASLEFSKKETAAAKAEVNEVTANAEAARVAVENAVFEKFESISNESSLKIIQLESTLVASQRREEETRTLVETLRETAREANLRAMNETEEQRDAVKALAAAEATAAIAREAEKHIRKSVIADMARTEDALGRVGISEAARVEAVSALRDAEAKLAAHAGDTTATTLTVKLGEKESALVASCAALEAKTTLLVDAKAALAAAESDAAVAHEDTKHARKVASGEKTRADEASSQATAVERARVEAVTALRDAEARIAVFSNDTAAVTLAAQLAEKEAALESKVVALTEAKTALASAESGLAVALQAEMHARQTINAEKTRADEALAREEVSEAARAEALNSLRDAEARIAVYASDTAATLAAKLEEKGVSLEAKSKALDEATNSLRDAEAKVAVYATEQLVIETIAATLKTKLAGKLAGMENVLEEKQAELNAASNEIAAMRSELTGLSVQSQRNLDLAESARADAEKTRDDAREGSEEYHILAGKATEAAAEAAAAKAAEQMARELAGRTQTDVNEWIERERKARVQNASSTQKFLAADEQLKETKIELKTTTKKCAEIEKANRDGEELCRRLTDELRQSKKVVKAAYISYQQTSLQLEDTKRVLEREQENSICMHQNSSQQKIYLANTAYAGLELGYRENGSRGGNGNSQMRLGDGASNTSNNPSPSRMHCDLPKPPLASRPSNGLCLPCRAPRSRRCGRHE